MWYLEFQPQCMTEILDSIVFLSGQLPVSAQFPYYVLTTPINPISVYLCLNETGFSLYSQSIFKYSVLPI